MSESESESGSESRSKSERERGTGLARSLRKTAGPVIAAVLHDASSAAALESWRLVRHHGVRRDGLAIKPDGAGR